jgi:hypothetical protein
VKKRAFLCTLVATAAAPLPALGQSKPGSASGSEPTLLTVTGDIAKTNRGAFDKSLDVLMAKHELAFDKAFALDYPMIAKLPVNNIDVTIEYDGKKHALSGPLLTDVLQVAGATLTDSTTLALRALDGYAPKLKLSEARRLGFIIATHRNGKPLALGGLGPLWAVYPADRFPDIMSREISLRFSACPWGLYHIAVANG